MCKNKLANQEESKMIGKTVTFKTGRNRTEYTAKVIGEDNGWLVTQDTGNNIVRKVRPSAATVV